MWIGEFGKLKMWIAEKFTLLTFLDLKKVGENWIGEWFLRKQVISYKYDIPIFNKK